MLKIKTCDSGVASNIPLNLCNFCILNPIVRACDSIWSSVEYTFLYEWIKFLKDTLPHWVWLKLLQICCMMSTESISTMLILLLWPEQLGISLYLPYLLFLETVSHFYNLLLTSQVFYKYILFFSMIYHILWFITLSRDNI